jgi:filamentous hemagglutinin
LPYSPGDQVGPAAEFLTAALATRGVGQGAADAEAEAIATNSGGSSFWSSTGSSTAVENAYGHWDKHMSEFPEYQNSVQYVQGAQDFVLDPPVGTLTKTRPNGDTLLYDPSTNTFAVKTINGAPRTMFRPQGGMTYWNKQ